MTTLSIGRLAKETGLSVETIRFYERQRLIDSPPRKESGYRQYNSEDVRRLRFIQEAKALGFSLKEIGELLSLRLDSDATCREARAKAQERLLDIEEKMRRLKRMQGALRKLVQQCPGQGPVSECPILEALDRRR
jgi:MerR family mercuric resistance operon transcriptional regulator